MSYFVYLNEGGWIVSEFEQEEDADNLISLNDTSTMSKIVAPSDKDTVKYLKYLNNSFISETQEDIDNEKLENIRADRNKLLLDCDWTDLPSCPLSNEKKAEWQSYRTALRDFPATISDLDNVTFPVPPS
jgi:hypothetical protein